MYKISYLHFFLALSILVCSCQNQNDRTNSQTPYIDEKEDSIIASTNIIDKKQSLGDVPQHITRTIIQDKKGNIWFATFEGVIKYDGNIFKNITKDITQVRFFSVLEDSQENLWFGSIGEGVYKYDGTSFQNISTKNGLINNQITFIYEDKKGKIWFGCNESVSSYDGISFQHYIIDENSITEAKPNTIIPYIERPAFEVNAIAEDGKGKMWLATRGNTFIFDGKEFSVVKHNEKSFNNVRSLIKDRKGNIWLGGADGLWMFDGNTFKKIDKNFINYIYEDRQGSIWITSEISEGYALSRLDLNPMKVNLGNIVVVKKANNLLFGILEDASRNMWVGSLNGTLYYDGNTFIDFKE